MALIQKEILLSHLQRAEGAEEVSLPIDFFRDLLYQAMPQPKQEQGEPVAWSITYHGCHCNNLVSNKTLAEVELKRLNDEYGPAARTIVPLYTTPQQRTWVGLTDADMTECIVQTCNTDDGTGDTRDLIRTVEAKLKEKNGA